MVHGAVCDDVAIAGIRAADRDVPAECRDDTFLIASGGYAVCGYTDVVAGNGGCLLYTSPSPRD